MKSLLKSIAIVSVLSATATTAQLIAFQHKPTMDAAPNPQSQKTGNNIIISDILGSQRSVSIFASFTRDVDSISSRLESQSTNTTLLAPLNTAISSLPRKPWEDASDYARLGEQAYLGEDGSGRAAKNLERFVCAHVAPLSPWQEGERIKTLAGREIWWETRDGKMFVMPDKIEIESVAKQANNGEIWIVKGVVNYAS